MPCLIIIEYKICCHKTSLSSISTFLFAQAVIRVHFDSIPYGMGNHAATINLMKRLREMGFNGKFECIYFNGSNEYYETEI